MGLAQWLDEIVNGIGRALNGSHYEPGEWQRSNPNNPIDGLFARIEQWERSAQHRAIEQHRASLRDRGINLEFYILDVGEECVKVDYRVPGKSILLMYGHQVPETKSAAIIQFDPYQAPHGTSLACQEFARCPEDTKDEIVYRILRPFQLLAGAGDMQAYYTILQNIFNSGYPIPVFKGVAIADEIRGFLEEIQQKALGGSGECGETYDLKWESSFQSTFEQIFKRHLYHDNDCYTPSQVLAGRKFERRRLLEGK